MSSVDYLDLCRLCLVKDRVSVPIFEGEGDVRQIFLKIAACLPVKVAREDELPKKICDDCVYKVELLYQFWNTTANAEKQLLQWLNQVGLEDKQGYVTGVLNPSTMKQEESGPAVGLGGVAPMQVSGAQPGIGIGVIDNMGLGMPIIITGATQQQLTTTVPMDTSSVPIQPVHQALPGPSNQPGHEQLSQTQTNSSARHQDDEEDTSEEEENSDDDCDADDGLPVKEESEEDPGNSRTIEPTTFVNVSLACDEPGPSGLQQQKIAEIPEMSMPQNVDGDPKSGSDDGRQRAGIDVKRTSDPRMQMRKRLASILGVKKPPGNFDNLTTILGGDVQPQVYDHLELILEENVQPQDSGDRKNGDKTSVNKESSISEDEDPAFGDDKVEHDPLETVEEKKRRKKYTCHVCNISFKLSGLYKKHIVKHSETRPFKCKVCEKPFKYNSGLKKHVREQHDESAPLYSCRMCEFSTKHYPYLQEHFTRKHTDDYKYKCKSCKKQFKVETDYKTHIAGHETAVCICDFCGLTYSNKTSLYFHINYKHTEKTKTFECKVCKKRLQSEKNLENHMQHHAQSYICEECGMKFGRKYSLTKHRRVHAKEKSHKCPVCGKGFGCLATQRVHFLTHGGARPYVCNVCGSKFTQRSSLMIHWKKQHPDASEPPPPVILGNILETIKSNLK